MGVFRDSLSLDTTREGDIVNITDQLGRILSSSGLSQGILCVFNPGSTGAITTIEYESGLVKDMEEALDRVFPRGIDYEHHKRWADGNGHSHIRASFLGPSMSIPFSNGKLDLGTWQQVVFLELDAKPRNRRLIVQLHGE